MQQNNSTRFLVSEKDACSITKLFFNAPLHVHKSTLEKCSPTSTSNTILNLCSPLNMHIQSTFENNVTLTFCLGLMHAELPHTIRLPSLMLIALAIFLLQCRHKYIHKDATDHPRIPISPTWVMSTAIQRSVWY